MMCKVEVTFVFVEFILLVEETVDLRECNEISRGVFSLQFSFLRVV